MASEEPTIQFKDVPGFPGYRVGSDGSVWSCLIRIRKPGFRAGFAYVTGEEWHAMTPSLNDTGRPVIWLRRKFRLVSRVMLETFVGPCPVGMEGCHNDGNPANNRLSNLRWDTGSANQHDRTIHGTDCRGSKNHAAKLTVAQVIEIRSEANAGIARKIIAKKHGVSLSTVAAIIVRRKWQHI